MSASTTNRKKKIGRLARSNRKRILYGVAKNPNTSPDVLSDLIKHEDLRVGIYAAFNGNITESDFQGVIRRFSANPAAEQVGVFNSNLVAFLAHVHVWYGKYCFNGKHCYLVHANGTIDRDIKERLRKLLTDSSEETRQKVLSALIKV